MTHGVARDVSRGVQLRMAKAFEHEVNAVRYEVSRAELAEIMIEVATMMGRTAAGTVATMVSDPATAAGVFQSALTGIAHAIEHGTSEALVRAMNGSGLESAS